RRSPTAARHCSRSARTRVTRSSPWSRSGCRAGRGRSSPTWPACRASRASSEPDHRPPPTLAGGLGQNRAVPIVRSPDPILPIELIALDIDGTLVGDELEIGPRTRAAVHAARRNGVVVSLVTGRMVSSALRFARELELDAPIVGYQGAIIRAIPAAGSKRLGR